MKYELPETDNDLIERAQQEYTDAQGVGGDAMRDAQHRLAWALVHSRDRSKVQLGVELSEQLLNLEEEEKREPSYYIVVGLYKQRKYFEARRRVASLIETWPNFRQGIELKSLIEDGIVKDGLVGLALGVGAVAVFGFGAIAAIGLRR